jgi:hypothetical protein
MRRFLLVLTFITFAGWSQPAQQQAQPPIPVKIEMPPTNPWVRVVELIIPGIIGAGLALLGVWFTNKNNAAANAANRQHQLNMERIKDEIAAEAKTRDNRWTFRKDIYCSTLKSTFMVMNGYMRVLQSVLLLKDNNAETRAAGERMLANAQRDLQLHGTDFLTSGILAPLALADDLASALEATWKHRLQPVVLNGVDIDAVALQMEIDRLTTLIGMLIQAGRKDLWGTPEDEAKPDTAT